MQVRKINNEPQFKMSLKINPVLRPAIAERGTDFIKSLDNYGSKISDIKLYNVVFDKNLQIPKILHRDNGIKKDFFAELKAEEQALGKSYEVPSGFDGDTIGGFYPDEPRVFRQLFGEQAKSKYKEFKKLNIYDQAAEYSRMLESLEIKRMIAGEKEKSAKRAKAAMEQEAQERLYQETDNIIDKYRYEEQPNTLKWWQRIFK